MVRHGTHLASQGRCPTLEIIRAERTLHSCQGCLLGIKLLRARLLRVVVITLTQEAVRDETPRSLVAPILSQCPKY